MQVEWRAHWQHLEALGFSPVTLCTRSKQMMQGSVGLSASRNTKPTATYCVARSVRMSEVMERSAILEMTRARMTLQFMKAQFTKKKLFG